DVVAEKIEVPVGAAMLAGDPFTTSKNERPCDRERSQGQDQLYSFFDILGLKTLRTLGDRELYAVAFLEGLVSVTHYRRIVDKYIPAGGPLNESKSFFIVEPFDSALLFAHYSLTPFLQLQHA